MNKRGLSEVVTTMLLILLGLVALASVWIIISNILSEGSDVDLGKFSVDVNFLRASINGNDVSFTVKRSTGAGDIAGLKFVISDGFNSEDFDEITGLEELQEKTFTYTLTLLNSENLKTASVAPIFNVNNKNILGEVTDTYTFGEGTFSGSSPGSGNQGGQNENGGGGSGGGGGTTGNQSQTCTPACSSGSTCINGVCVPPQCQPESQSQTCGTWICSTRINNCGEIINCGTCPSDKICNTNNGQCEQITPINGTVYSVWPFGVAVYFDSADLPTNDVYSGYYAKFLPPSQENECLQIEDYSLPQPPQTRVIVKLLATQTSIAANDNLQLWPTYESCIL